MAFSVKIESCPHCKGTGMENLVRVEPGQPPKVYVRCDKCKVFVARYTLEHYTSDKPYESLLSSLHGQGCCISSRQRALELEAFSREVEEEFIQTTNVPISRHRVEELIVGMMVEGKIQED